MAERCGKCNDTGWVGGELLSVAEGGTRCDSKCPHLHFWNFGSKPQRRFPGRRRRKPQQDLPARKVVQTSYRYSEAEREQIWGRLMEAAGHTPKDPLASEKTMP